MSDLNRRPLRRLTRLASLLTPLLLTACGDDGPPLDALVTEIDPAPELTYTRIKGVVEGTDDDGTYMHLLASLKASEGQAELEGYAATERGTTYVVETLLKPEILLYDQDQLYLLLSNDDCEIELEGRYTETVQLTGSTEARYLSGRMAVRYGLIDEELEVGGEEGDVQWFIEFQREAGTDGE